MVYHRTRRERCTASRADPDVPRGFIEMLLTVATTDRSQ